MGAAGFAHYSHASSSSVPGKAAGVVPPRSSGTCILIKKNGASAPTPPSQSTFAAALVCSRQRASRRVLTVGPKERTHWNRCINLGSPWVRSDRRHAWTPHSDFAVTKSLTQPLTVGIVAFEKRAHLVILHTDRPDHGSGGQPMADIAGREVLGPLFRGNAELQSEKHATQHVA